MLRAVSTVAAALALVCSATGSASPTKATAAPAARERPPVLLMFHSGSFWLGNAASMAPAAVIAARDGFDPVLAEYPLGDLSKAVRWSRRLASKYERQGRDVYAYGESAGGTLAALLADGNRAVAAATYSPLPDIAKYTRSLPDPGYYARLIDATYAQMRRYSPTHRKTKTPILAMIGESDYPIIRSTVHRWDRRYDNVRSTEFEGGHIGADEPPAVYVAAVEKLMRWLDRHASESKSR
jgi:acetyl esterase/lipase